MNNYTLFYIIKNKEMSFFVECLPTVQRFDAMVGYRQERGVVLNSLDMYLIAIPETAITIFFGIKLGLNQKEINLHKKRDFMLKILISVISISMTLCYIRLSGDMLISYMTVISFFLYSITYKFIFNMNLRKSIIVGSISIFIIICSEIIFLPTMELELIENPLKISIYMRIFQLLILIVTSIFNISISNLEILKIDWKDLSKSGKINIIAIIILITSCIIFIASYSDLFLKLLKVLNQNEIENIKGNLILYFFENIIFISLVMYFITNTRKYYTLKEFIERGSEELLFDLLEMAEKHELKAYNKITALYTREVLKEDGDKEIIHSILELIKEDELDANDELKKLQEYKLIMEKYIKERSIEIEQIKK